ncbi:MAG: OmpA family protein [Ectothiorhodospiraceae bacterium]
MLTTVIGGSAPEASAAPAATPLSGRVFFRVNSTTVDPRFDALMSEIAEALAQSGDAFAEIVGYTDTTGPPEYNRYLSNRRAEAVAEKLRERGVPDDRLQIEGQGPREPESGEAGFRAEDRVVEITVLHGSEG